MWRARRQETVRMMAETASAAMGSARARRGMWKCWPRAVAVEAEEDGDRRPDVGGEVGGVCGESLGLVREWRRGGGSGSG